MIGIAAQIVERQNGQPEFAPAGLFTGFLEASREGDEPIPSFRDRLDETRSLNVIAQNPPQFGYRARQRRLAEIPLPPDRAGDFLLRDELARVARQQKQQIRQQRSQVHGSASAGNTA